jgi:hypothetical protein
MDPIIIEFLGGLLGGALAGLAMMTLVLRTRHLSPTKMPLLTIKKPRSASSVRRQRTSSPADRGPSTITFAKTRRKARTKTLVATIESSQRPTITAATAESFDTCPSCGLQAPGSLLAEHFLGSPSHKNGPPKIVKADAVKAETGEEAKEDDSTQSMRNLLQMLVPPRAFGHRHAHKSVSPISSIVKELGPSYRHYP